MNVPCRTILLTTLKGSLMACGVGEEPVDEETRRTGIFMITEEVARVLNDPELVVGTEPPLLLDRVRGAVFFGQGVAIANAGSKEILLVSFGGDLLARTGGEGAGPGEYGGLTGLARHGAGLVAWDAFLLRVSELDSNGDFVRSARVSIPPYSEPILVGGESGTAYFHFRRRGFDVARLTGPTQERLPAVFSAVRLSDGTVVHSEVIPDRELWGEREERGHGALPVIFGRESASAVAWGGGILSTSDSMWFRWVSPHEGLEDRTLKQPLIPARSEWERLARDTIRATTEAYEPGEIFLDDGRNFMMAVAERRTGLERELPARQTLPAYSQLKGGPEGWLWIAEYPHPSQELVRWVALNSELELEFAVDIPRRFRVADISKDRVIVLARGAMDEELVEIYRIE